MSEVLSSARLIADPLKLVAFNFAQDNVAASQSNVQLNVVEVASAATLAVDGITIPWAGSIVGLSYSLSAAATAGSMTIGATVGGTEGADPTITVTTGTSGSDTAARGKADFAAGAQIGVEITTDGSWDGTSSDLVVTVWCLVEVTGV